MRNLLIIGGLIWLMGSLGSCKKETFLDTGGAIRFSTDTLSFDTVFTQFASFTLSVKVFNPQDQKINISNIRLEKGDNSFFTLNVNGIPGTQVNDVEVAANDSFYVFATVNIDPNNENNPFVIEDKLIASLNGKEFSIPVIAYGQNAHYIIDSVIEQNTTWVNDKPYVILQSALVDTNITLTINPGCRIYMNQDSRLYVMGRLIANGTKEDSIIFQGNRLDRAYFGYEGYPGEWGGIYFHNSGFGSEMNWVTLKNCGNNSGGGLPFAIEVYGSPGIPTQLTMNNTIIENSIGYGLLSFTGNIKAQNCLIHTCGAQALAILQGGSYEFDNCDFVIYQPTKVKHFDNPTVAVLNYFDVSETQRLVSDLDARFRNCIIYGSLENELFCDRSDTVPYNVSFENCLIQSEDAIPNYVSLTNCILNTNPMFEDVAQWDFRLQAGSPLIDNGITITPITNDLNDRTWMSPFDMGCYQYE